MIKRFLLSAVLLILPLWARADLAADIAASTGSVTITSLATQVDEPVVFLYVKGSDLPAGFWTALDAASDTDFHTVFATTGDGSARLPMWVTLPNTSTDTGGIWIRALETMSASVDVDYILWAGNTAMSTPAATDPYGRDAVFGGTGGYVGGYMPGLLLDDITGGGRTLTAVNSPGTAASGLEGITAATYNGTSQLHTASSAAVTAWPVTVEALAYTTSATAAQFVCGLGASGNANNYAGVTFDGTETTPVADPVGAFFRGNSTTLARPFSSAAFTTSTWHYLVGSQSSSYNSAKSYLDGGNSNTVTTTLNSTFSPNQFGIGASYRSTTTSYLAGRVAVALLSDSVRSADYVSTMQDNWAGALYSTGAWVPNDAAAHPWFYWRYRK